MIWFPESVINKVSSREFLKHTLPIIARLHAAIRSGVGSTHKSLFEPVLSDEKTANETDETVANFPNELVFAGSETTFSSLTYLVWAVLSRAPVQQCLVAEVVSLPEDFSLAQLEKLPYLSAVLNETMRLYGTASGSTLRDITADGWGFQCMGLPRRT